MNYPNHSIGEQVQWLITLAPVPGSGWMLAAEDLDRSLPLAIEVFPQAPGAEEIWFRLEEMLRAAGERKQKPLRMLIEPEWLREALLTRLQAAGIAVGATGQQHPAIALAETASLPGLLETPGMTPPAARAFFHAAGRFTRAAPWALLEAGDVLAARADPPGWQRFLVFSGESDEEFGLSAFPDLQSARQALPAGGAPHAALPEDGLLALAFAPRAALPEADRAAIRRYRWPAPGGRSYPLPLRLTQAGPARPGRDELLFLEAVLTALPDFARDALPGVLDGDEAGALAEYEVESSAGTVRVEFSYPAGWQPGADFAAWEAEFALSEDEKQALALAHAAWREAESAQRVELARQALALSPHVPEALLALAEEAEVPAEALDWLEQAVQAGRRWAAPPEGAPPASRWAFRPARPYLRALQAKAETLEQLGRAAEALQVYQSLLELNPDDHTGARYPALGLLLRLKQDGHAAALIERYTADSSPDWEYSRALILFRAQGDSPQARRALQRAVRHNPQAAAYLSGAQPMPADPDETGSQPAADAAAYALHSYPTWWSTPGAIEWLRSVV